MPLKIDKTRLLQQSFLHKIIMRRAVDFESVLSLIDQAISPTYLNPTQEIVLREVWNGKTYSKMADDYNYDPEYIKTVGCNLWQTLSRAFDEQINKSNFVPFMRQRIGHLLDETTSKSPPSDRLSTIAQNFESPNLSNWTTAPNIRRFVGRKEELATLYSWSSETDCRLIVVSGMIGCGKTTLVTEFAKSVQHEYDGVIWFSLSQLPSLTELLSNYLRTLDRNSGILQDSKPQELSFLLSEFIECLRRQKILLIIDGLQHILEVNQASASYRKEYEGYGQFLRSIISTNHQSLLITTSRIKPKLLEYYADNQVKFLNLQGLKPQTIKDFICQNKNTTNNPSLEESELLHLSKSLQNNPQLLRIANTYHDIFWEEGVEQMVQNLSLLEAISELLEQELSYICDLEKEMIYWLAISCTPLSRTELSKYMGYTQPTLKLLGSIKSLEERSLVVKQNDSYSLMPVMKAYLRRKLVKQAL